MTLFRVTFTNNYDGSTYKLDTTDPGKIGPWLAEMFGLFPWDATVPSSVDIRSIEGFR